MAQRSRARDGTTYLATAIAVIGCTRAPLDPGAKETPARAGLSQTSVPASVDAAAPVLPAEQAGDSSAAIMVEVEEARDGYTERVVRPPHLEALHGWVEVGARQLDIRSSDRVLLDIQWRIGWSDHAVLESPDAGNHWLTSSQIGAGELAGIALFADGIFVGISREGDIFYFAVYPGAGGNSVVQRPMITAATASARARELGSVATRAAASGCLVTTEKGVLEVEHSIKGCFNGQHGTLRVAWNAEGGTIMRDGLPTIAVGRERAQRIATFVARELAAPHGGRDGCTTGTDLIVSYDCNGGPARVERFASSTCTDTATGWPEGRAEAVVRTLMVVVAQDAAVGQGPPR